MAPTQYYNKTNCLQHALHTWKTFVFITTNKVYRKKHSWIHISRTSLYHRDVRANCCGRIDWCVFCHRKQCRQTGQCRRFPCVVCLSSARCRHETVAVRPFCSTAAQYTLPDTLDTTTTDHNYRPQWPHRRQKSRGDNTNKSHVYFRIGCTTSEYSTHLPYFL